MGTAVHEEIYRILTSHGVENTQNQYGIHVELSAVDDAVIAKVSDFVDYCASKDQDLREYDERLNQYKINKRFDELPYTTAAIATTQQSEQTDASTTHDDAVRSAPSPSSFPLPSPPPPQPLAAPEAITRLFSSILPMEADNGAKKRATSNSKFTALRKSFAKGKRVDRRGTESCVEARELQPEPYLITSHGTHGTHGTHDTHM